jgi:hypothetical protein
MGKDIVAKWHKAKAKLEEAKIIENDLRAKLVDSLLTGNERSKTFEFADEKYTAGLSTRYSIAKGDVLALKKKISKGDFKKLFGVSYSVRGGALSELGVAERQLVEKHISETDVYSITKK